MHIILRGDIPDPEEAADTDAGATVVVVGGNAIGSSASWIVFSRDLAKPHSDASMADCMVRVIRLVKATMEAVEVMVGVVTEGTVDVDTAAELKGVGAVAISE